MADLSNKPNNTLKYTVYGVLIILVGVASYYYYSYLQQSSAELNVSTTTTISKKLAGRTLDTEILKDKKFQELQSVVVDESLLGGPATSSANQVVGVTLEQVANIPRRHSNPFKPF